MTHIINKSEQFVNSQQALIETLYACENLKTHMVHGIVFAIRKVANSVLFEYIEIYYNRIRRYSVNGG